MDTLVRMERAALRILLVEDNELNRDMLSRRLEKRGFVVEMATDGRKAVELALQLQPDVILMDMSLPILDGWEATRILRREPRTQGIPVIGLTAHALEQERRRAFEAGVSAFETKPVDFEQLLGTIDELCSPK